MRATELIDARHRRGHTVWLRFRDGTAGEIDLKQELRGNWRRARRAEPLRPIAPLE